MVYDCDCVGLKLSTKMLNESPADTVRLISSLTPVAESDAASTPHALVGYSSRHADGARNRSRSTVPVDQLSRSVIGPERGIISGCRVVPNVATDPVMV